MNLVAICRPVSISAISPCGLSTSNSLEKSICIQPNSHCVELSIRTNSTSRWWKLRDGGYSR